MTDYWSLILFNLLYTSVPPIIYGVLDQDVPAEVLLYQPELYKSGQKDQVFLGLSQMLECRINSDVPCDMSLAS